MHDANSLHSEPVPPFRIWSSDQPARLTIEEVNIPTIEDLMPPDPLAIFWIIGLAVGLLAIGCGVLWVVILTGFLIWDLINPKKNSEIPLSEIECCTEDGWDTDTDSQRSRRDNEPDEPAILIAAKSKDL